MFKTIFEKVKTEAIQIIIGTAIGACVCATITVATSVWLGLPTGFAAGYLAYRFGEVVKATPRAAEAAAAKMRQSSRRELAEFATWLRKPHPFILAGALLSLATTIAAHTVWPEMFLFAAWEGMANGVLAQDIAWYIRLAVAVALPATAGMYFYIVGHLMAAPIGILAQIGSKAVEKTFWMPSWMVESAEREKELHEMFGEPSAPTYRNVARWTLLGAVYLVVQTVRLPALALFHALISAAFAVDGVVTFAVHFPRQLIRLVHSHQRVTCGVDGVISGLLAVMLVGEHMLTAALAGMVIGAAIGCGHYAAAKRWLPARLASA